MSSKVNISKETIEIKSKNIEKENKKFLDALSAFTPAEEKKEINMNQDVLAQLKNKLNTQPEAPNKVSIKQKKSLNIGFVGVGQAGSRIAETMYGLDYDACAINTSKQDLEFIQMPESNKLLLEGTLGGTGKDLNLSKQIFDSYKDDILSFVEKQVEGNDMIYLTTSLGGGSGSGSVSTMIPLLFSLGMPVGVICVLPKATDDAQSKNNSIQTLGQLARMATENMISSLIVVDNARIEHIYGNLSQAQFWKTSNKAIIEPLHIFNTLTAQASEFTSLDPSDFGKIISCGDCSVYGVVEVENYMPETALAEAVINSLNSNLLSDGFTLNQTRIGGVIIAGSREAMENLPAINIDYMYHMISEQTGGANIFRGIYSDETIESGVKIYSWFAGLGLPQDRIINLQKESKEQEKVFAEKDKARASNMTLNLDENKTNSVVSSIHDKIKQNKSSFNKLQGFNRDSIIDRRKK